MSVLLSSNVLAKTSFQKTQVNGVMSTGIGSSVVVTWESVKGADGYEVYEWLEERTAADDVDAGTASTDASDTEPLLLKTTSACKVIIRERIPGFVYHYYVRAYKSGADGTVLYSKASKEVTTEIPEYGSSTIKNFLKTAITPIGSTMYVWGGGWNKADTGAGKEARRTGLAASWRSFAANKRSNYNYRNYRYQIHDGLDCSGYVGWCVYNVRNAENGRKGYVYSASKQAKKFADLGFGDYISREDVSDYEPGDIMSSACSCCGHVWIVIGQCQDGSVVLVHASPPGVQLSGTVTPSGKKNSEAYKLAKKYMKKYYPNWYNRYPEVSKGITYLEHYGQLKWNTEGSDVVLSDPDGYRDMSAGEVLKDLFGE